MEIFFVVVVALIVLRLVWRRKSEFEGVPVTNEQRPIVEEFQKRQRRQWLLGVPILVVVAGLVWVRSHPESAPSCLTNPFVVAFGFIAAMAALAFSFSNWRCPACGKYLGKRNRPSSCPWCKARFEA